MFNSTCVILQINASDERSASAIETRILDVVQMNSVTADSRPKCLVCFTYSLFAWDLSSLCRTVLLHVVWNGRDWH